MTSIIRIVDYSGSQIVGELVEGRLGKQPPDAYLEYDCQLVAGESELTRLRIHFSDFRWGTIPDELGHYVFYCEPKIPDEYRKYLETGLHLKLE